MSRSRRQPGSSIAALVVAVVGIVGSSRVAAAQDTLAKQLPPVTVTRDVGRSPLDLPYGITNLRPDSLAPGQAHTQIEQTLALLPGVTVADRTNPSQDTRISIRGFGARSQFGARSIRILRDGMPLTNPDGQTPIDYLDLESVGSVEVIRGAASALYGNASGGVIDLQSPAPPDAPFALQGRSWGGSSGFERYVGLFGGTLGPAGYQGNVGRTVSDGYRAFSQQRLTNAFVHATTDVGKTQLSLVGLGMNEPLANNPGQLTRAQADSAPWMADPLSLAKRARKVAHQVQIGLQARRPVFSDGELTAQVYGGTRSLYNPQTFAIVGIDRHQSGANAQLTVPFTTGSVVNRVSVGADAQYLDDKRKNWANCNGLTAATATCPSITTEEGAISLNQQELVSSIGPYVRDEVEIGQLRASAGLRDDEVRFVVHDHYFGDGMDNSGSRTMGAVSPMIGIADRLSPLHSIYANVGSVFETPTTTELGNQPDGSGGLNRTLQPQFSTTYETGTKGLALDRLQYDVALFDTEVRNELIPYEIPNGNGRTYYLNAGHTRRQGVELGLMTEVGPVSLEGSYAYSHFHFRDFVSGGVQLAGNAIPGIPEQQAQLDATWHFSHAFVVAEGLAKSNVFVNDANSASAPGFAIMNARVGGTAVFGRPWLSPVIGVQNLFDRRYIGSVAINASGATIASTKFYEPSPGRTWLIGLSAATNPW